MLGSATIKSTDRPKTIPNAIRPEGIVFYSTANQTQWHLLLVKIQRSLYDQPEQGIILWGANPEKKITTTILAGMKLAPPNIVQFNDPCPSRFLRSQATALIQPSTFYSTRFFRSENGVKNRLAIWEKVNKHHKIRA